VLGKGLAGVPVVEEISGMGGREACLECHILAFVTGAVSLFPD